MTKNRLMLSAIILGPDQADCDHLKLVSAAAKHLVNGAVRGALRRAKQYQMLDVVLINMTQLRHRYFITILKRTVFD